MRKQKISISLSRKNLDFIKYYQAEHHYSSRIDVIKEAIRLLEQAYLEGCYLEANKEIDHD